MAAPKPRLLIAARDRPDFRDAVRRHLPQVPFAFLEELTSGPSPSVEAVLLGSISRDATGWDPAVWTGLRFVQRIFAGVDDLPFDRFPPSVQIAGNVGGYAPFVAEHAVALALAAARGVLPGQAMIATGRIRPPPPVGSFWRSTAVVLGYGAIGRAIADRLRGFGATIHGVNRTGAPVAGCDRMFPASDLVRAVGTGSFFFDARPLTTATAGSIGAEELNAMPAEATFVNVGRGGTVVEAALYRHLVDHPGFRAALDVWWEEDFARGTMRTRFPFAQLPNFVGSPHLGGISPAVERFARETALDNVGRFFRGEAPLHVVDRAEYDGLHPSRSEDGPRGM